MPFSTAARGFGMASAWSLVGLLVVYGLLLAYGLATLPTPGDPVQGPVFVALELLIVAPTPALAGLLVALHAWAPNTRRVYSAAAVLFAVMTAIASGLLHGVILILSDTSAWASLALEQALSFRWPSVAYAVDIMAWDVWFPLSMFCAAAVLRGGGLQGAVRIAMLVSGLLAALGLVGAVTEDMQVRNIGIVGYTVGLIVVAALLGVLFRRTVPTDAHVAGSV